MKENCKVVMLPTQSRAVRLGQLVIGAGNNLFSSRQSNDIGSLTAYELYITSNEEIKKNDWVINYSGVIAQWGGLGDLHGCKKIIATTDTSLKVIKLSNLGENWKDIPLPQPSQEFIRYFIEEYNKGNVITKVMVEYNYELSNDEDEQGNLIPDIYLKINSDNTINIKPIKDSWDLNEIKVFAVKCFNAGRQYQIDSIDVFNDKWIEENI